jgi:Right handed beta helix region
MQRLIAMLAGMCLLSAPIYADDDHRVVDCSRRPLRQAIAEARDRDATIEFTGTCSGPIVIRTDGLTLKGVGDAVIDGRGQVAVTITGASGVKIAHLEVRNGSSGIVAANGAHVTMQRVQSRDNAAFGISLQTASSAVLSEVITANNGLHGLDLQTGSAATIVDTFAATGNQVFGINVNGSSITFSAAEVSSSGNTLGIQIATNADAFIADRTSVINVTDNLATGLTVVSGAHLVSFGGTINASRNGAIGVSVNSKAGLDLDAGSMLQTGNGEGMLIQQGSVVTVFNNPQFSGAQGFSTIEVLENRGNGLRVQTGSTLTLSNQARVNSARNARLGLLADNGAGLTLVNSTITGNAMRDIQLTFGTRADLQTLSFGTATCDATVLIRGSSGISCPQ